MAQVNALHGQGINRLGQGLRALARAPDAKGEALSVQGASAFAYAVQWHAQWACEHGGLDGAILKAFGESCRVRRQNRHDPQDVKGRSDPWRT